MSPLDLEKYLHEQIPASSALKIEVKSCSKTKIELMAPLSENFNHKNTAFGGSLSVIAILSGWSLIFMRLHGVKNEIVIQESSMSFLKPVKGEFLAASVYDDSVQWSRFMKAFSRRGKGRIVVNSDVYCHGEVVAKHSGTYVAFKKLPNLQNS